MGRDLDCMADVADGVPPIHFFQAEHRRSNNVSPRTFQTALVNSDYIQAAPIQKRFDVTIQRQFNQ